MGVPSAAVGMAWGVRVVWFIRGMMWHCFVWYGLSWYGMERLEASTTLFWSHCRRLSVNGGEKQISNKIGQFESKLTHLPLTKTLWKMLGNWQSIFFYKCSSICRSVHLLQLNEAMRKIISIPPAKKLKQSWPACSWTPPVSSSSPPTPSSSLVALAWSKDGSLTWWTFFNKKWLSPLPQTCWTYWPDGFCSQRSFWLHQLQSLQRRCSQAWLAGSVLGLMIIVHPSFRMIAKKCQVDT